MADQLNGLTPKQVKAGRALLAWSQQDLAKNSGVAASTVADFERGQRSPVPNNAEAIRNALERAGVSFPPGGATIGPQPPPLAMTTGKPGTPIRWANATDISQWAERRAGQGSLPELLCRLARASGPMSIHFPSDEGVQFGGWDGTTDSREDFKYVPKGSTGWEIGTQRTDIAGKADDDYKKRTQDPQGLVLKESTFIFVTPRHWPKKSRWAAEKRAEQIWKDVRAYDGTDLVHWVESYPAVGHWLATHLGLLPSGTLQLEEIWLEWSQATSWALPLSIVLSDRDDEATQLLRWLRSEPSLLALQGETVEEVRAFAYAAISQLPDDVAQHYLARCLVATTADAARHLAGSESPLIIILQDSDPGLAQSIANKGHHVLLAYSASTLPAGDIRQLPRLSRNGIEASLQEVGVPESKCATLAHDASGSLAILRRLIPRSPGQLPSWALNPPTRALIAALLAGSWDEGCDGDKIILSKISGIPYESIVEALAPLAAGIGGPLRKVGQSWKVASLRDAWFLLAKYITDQDINRFQSAIVDVLSEADPRFELDEEERFHASFRGIKPSHSEFLRHGLSEVLIVLALFGSYAHAVQNADRIADYVVQQLIGAADEQRWWSLSRDFRLLAEAAPKAFLDAVDRSLDQEVPQIRVLFGGNENLLFGTEHLSNLLWALESLAWSPMYLTSVASILARLDELDPGSRNGNRPYGTLRDIFLLWFPQTNATLEQRIQVIDWLRQRNPRQAWRLMLDLLPSGHDHVSPAAKTRWRELAPNYSEVVTYQLIGKGADELAKRLLADAGINANRWINLLDRLTNMPNRPEAIDALETAVGSIDDIEARVALWDHLRKMLHHHRQFPDAGWVLPSDELNSLAKIYEKLEPRDEVAKFAWLFSHAVSLPDPSGDWQDQRDQVQARQIEQAKRLLDTLDVKALAHFAEAVESPAVLGVSLVDAKSNKTSVDSLLSAALTSAKDHELELARGIIVAKVLQDPNKKEWIEELLLRAITEQWSEESMLTVLFSLNSDSWAWRLAEHVGASVNRKYWERISLFSIRAESEELELIVSRLIDVGRARHAVHVVGQHLQNGAQSSTLLVKVLLEATHQPWESNPHSNDVTMFQHYVAEILKQLDVSDDVSPDDLVTIEWAYLPVLEHSRRPPKHILKALATDPNLFVEMIKTIFKPSADSGVSEPAPENLEQAKNIASQAYSLLRIWDVVPGSKSDGAINSVELADWVAKARELAKLAGREVIAEQKIGEILSASSIGSDGNWPAEPVRDLIEQIRSTHIETGLVIGRRNRRGVTHRIFGDGGGQERSLAAQYRAYAKATALQWPRTSAMLEDIARDYDKDARWHDEDVERMNW